ncbi:hypothetical protein Mp_1g27290 [Marchantia polymorpha subsp. ruderalis]|uniref:Uncharacterized protein n=2 Tax=Marchantia polymorpha TaxID=3197 RepID=A0AAF6AUT9_MARPO|nr:hypothetical protein MARPO_0002s0149 [Marchantia polymorpha]BBN00210.1 hypothetical protein Mp_1g27290 [Marchantia polymorpha subsp. ruderalis]|eukprot:PTQ49674.1 hypothetical protein MARPO_0002s0149 [Marchantia polymorpha]
MGREGGHGTGCTQSTGGEAAGLRMGEREPAMCRHLQLPTGAMCTARVQAGQRSGYPRPSSARTPSPAWPPCTPPPVLDRGSCPACSRSDSPATLAILGSLA